MINVDISNVWGQVSLPDLLALEQEIFNAHQTKTDGTYTYKRYCTKC